MGALSMASSALLLDSCALIWVATEPARLTAAAQKALDGAAAWHVSEATVLELTLKHAKGKLVLPSPPRVWFAEEFARWKIKPLPLSREVIFRSGELPFHHEDPFDRLIIASAMEHALPVVTADGFFGAYPVKVVW